MIRSRSCIAWTAAAVVFLVAAPTAPAAEGSDAADLAAAISAADGLSVELWAREPLLGSPVAIAFDHAGRAYVTQTVRRRSSAIPIRDHTDWMTDDLSFASVEDMRAFLRRTLDPSRSEAHRGWLRDLNGDGSHDWRDLAVESDRVHLIEDSDGDGRADRSTVFAEGFDTEVSDVAAGVLWHGGDVYLTLAPDLWKLRDSDGDGRADRRRSLSHGYGVHFGYSGHNLHGPVIGPDGMIYWSVGDVGLNVTGPDGRRWVHPHEGAVMRCFPDGGGFEVFATGLRNPQELAFDSRGNLFTVDNDSDMADDRERIVYIAEGSDSGWRINWQYGGSAYVPWLEEGLFRPHFEGQAAYITPPVASYSDGPAGFAYNPGTALNERHRGRFFIAEFTGTAARGKVSAFALRPKGAGFELAEHHDVVGGVLTTGLAFGPDGALYLADWVEGWVPHEKGRIWKVDAPAAAGSELRRGTRRLLAVGMGERPSDELVDLLAHADMRVRQAAQFELVRRGDERRLAAVALDSGPGATGLARLHAIWGWTQLVRSRRAGTRGGAEAQWAIVGLLSEGDAEVRAQAARAIGEARYAPAAGRVIRLLRDPSPRVRYFAAIALGRIGAREAFEPLVEMIGADGGRDPWLRHAGVMGLTGIGAVEPLAGLASHRSRQVRLAAVVALRRRSDPAVAVFLRDADELVIAEAARAIHDDLSIPDALPALAAVVEREGLTHEALLRRAINANLRIGGPEHAQRLARYAARSSAPSSMRIEALRSLAVWAEPPVLDRVEGNHRPLGPRDLRHRRMARAALAPVLDRLLGEGPTEVRIAAAQAAGELRYEAAAEALHAMTTAPTEPPELRLAALTALGSIGGEHLSRAVAAVLGPHPGAPGGRATDRTGDEHAALRNEARRLLAGIDPSGESAIAALAETLETGSTAERQHALATLGGMDSPAAREVLGRWMDKLLAGEAEPAIRLDLLEAAEASGSAELAAKARRYEQARPSDDPLAGWLETLHGGDAERGRKIVFEHIAAQCLRCHRIDGRGGQVAPDLSRIGGRADRRSILQSLVDPNAQIAEGYGTTLVTLADGRTLAGTAGQETETRLIVQTLDGQAHEIDKSQVTSRQATRVSAMPPMNGVLTRRQVRDVVAYLAGLR